MPLTCDKSEASFLYGPENGSHIIIRYRRKTESCGKKQGQYGLVIYGLSSIHDAKVSNNIGLLKTQQYYLIQKNGWVQKKMSKGKILNSPANCVDTWIRTKDPHHVKVIL